MTTLFITSFNPFIGRNILSTDVLKILSERSGLRIVILVPAHKTHYFLEHYSGPNVFVEGLAPERYSRRDVVFTYLGSSLVYSRTLAIHKREGFRKDKNLFKFLFSFGLRKLLGKSKLFKKAIRALDLKLTSTGQTKAFFNQYSPQLVFSTDVFNNEDVQFLAEAKRRGIFTIGMIRSWDNITSKGVFRVKPDKLIVHNETIKEEAVQHNVMRARDVFTSGLPQYDSYLKGERMPRREFFARLKLDPEKKLILFSPFGDRFFKYDWQIMEILKELGVQVLARLPPHDSVDLSQFESTPLFYIDRPGHQFRDNYFRDTELNEKDLMWLADCLYHSDLVVTGGATIAVDAALFDKPSVLIYFDGFLNNLPYLKSARRWLDFDHGRQVWQSGGVRISRSKEELLQASRAYLENPALDSEKRKAMVLKQVSKLDGNSGRRIAEFILSFL